jgi:hypothetical protein
MRDGLTRTGSVHRGTRMRGHGTEKRWADERSLSTWPKVHARPAARPGSHELFPLSRKRLFRFGTGASAIQPWNTPPQCWSWPRTPGTSLTHDDDSCQYPVVLCAPLRALEGLWRHTSIWIQSYSSSASCTVCRSASELFECWPHV